MNPILAELGKKVVDRWLTALLLPGLLYAGVLSCAALAGHRHALDPEHLAVALDDVVRRLQHRPVRVVLAATTLLLVASLTAVLARELAGLVQRGLTCGRPTRWVRFRAACAKHRDAPRAAYVQHKTSAVGDHFALLELRSRIQYGIDIELAWPRLWLLLPEGRRAPVQDAYAGYEAALTACGWAVLYLAITIVWWPAALVAAVIAAVGYRRCVVRSMLLAEVIESVADIHYRDLAAAVGVDLPHGRVTSDEGLRITDILNKRDPARHPVRPGRPTDGPS